MAHFAKLDQNNIVAQVVVVGDEYETTYAQSRLEFGEVYVQTSYNNKIRKRYAGIGYSWDSIRDVFMAPQCHEEAILNQESTEWECSNVEHKRELS